MALVVSLLPSCSSITPQERAQIAVNAKDGINILEPAAWDKPYLYIVGTTELTDKREYIPFKGKDITETLTSKLRAKGYKVANPAKGESGKGNPVGLSLSSAHSKPRLYLREHLYAGTGVHQSYFMGIPSNLSVHCNYNARLYDLRQDKRIGYYGYDDSVKQAGAKTSVKRSIRRWSDLSAGEQQQITRALQQSINDTANRIIEDLGL